MTDEQLHATADKKTVYGGTTLFMVTWNSNHRDPPRMTRY